MKTARSPHDSLVRTNWLLLAAIGCLHLVTALFMGEGEASFRAALFAWSLAPYFPMALALRRRGGRIGLLAGASLMALVDACTFWSVFVAPQSSTAPLGLLMAPAVNLLFVAPLSIAIDLWLGRRA